MNDMAFPIRTAGHDPWADIPEPPRPIGHDAPKHSVEWSNYQAACIAARDVSRKAIHCERHRESLAAWSRGERSWPWPDPTPEEQDRADDAVRSMLPGLLTDAQLVAHSRDQNRFKRRV